MEKYNDSLAHAGNYRYYAKEGEGPNARYFYSKEEYDAWRNGSNAATAPVPQPGDRPEPGEHGSELGKNNDRNSDNTTYGNIIYGNTVAPRGTYDSGYGNEHEGPSREGITQIAAVRNTSWGNYVNTPNRVAPRGTYDSGYGNEKVDPDKAGAIQIDTVRNSSWGNNYTGGPTNNSPNAARNREILDRNRAPYSAPAPNMPASAPGRSAGGSREQERYGADSVASNNPNYGANAQNTSRGVAPAPNLPRYSIPNDAANRYNGAVPRYDSGRYNDTRAGMNSASKEDKAIYDATINANRTNSSSNSKPTVSGSNSVTTWDNVAKTAWDNAKSTYNAVSPVVANAASKAVQAAGNTIGSIKNYASQVCQSASSWIQNLLKKK